ncbi:MAG: carbohydrate kinase family protein [Candidatus Kaiserbacteria bacterium]|nr:carbohydrate kinase family protein [Candidatus Kaiserbacteria bacterium]MCB9816260.1 carbohydrate kinase family protein [Candidatus Nomurabacteria bacterium]
MSQQYDFVAIGDILIDAFIKLNIDQADVSIDMDTGRKTLHMPFGSKLPYDDVTVVPAVGNSPNAAVSAHRLGLETGLVTNLGHDKFGKECLDALRQEGVHTDFVKIHEDKKTNYHYVLRYGPERTILINHEHYPYSLPDFPVAPKFFYFSSVGEHGLPYHHEIAEYVKNNETKLAFQPGTFQIKVGYEAIKDVYEASEIFFCNKEEAQEILSSTEQDIPTLVRAIRELGPTIPVITDGPNGAFTVDADDQAWHMPMYPDPAPPVDRTGAGDSFSSTFTSAIILGKDPAEALAWGPINSMNVVQHVGAQAGLLSREELLKHLENRPEDYVATKIN